MRPGNRTGDLSRESDGMPGALTMIRRNTRRSGLQTWLVVTISRYERAGRQRSWSRTLLKPGSALLAWLWKR